MKAKKVLLLATYFPPLNNIACYRSGCFAKFLPEFGWEPTVVCEDWTAGKGAAYDPEFVGEIPQSVRIERIPRPIEKGFWQRTVQRKLLPYLAPHKTPRLWWKQAYARIERLLEKHSFDAVWATSDPLGPSGLAASFAKRHRIPWILDLRDSFNLQPMGSWYKRPFLAYRERRLCAQADQVVTVSEGMAKKLQTHSKKNIKVIHNGFDPTLFPVDSKLQSDKFTLLYAGKLYHDHAPLLRALELNIKQSRMEKELLEYRVLGVSRAHFESRCTYLPQIVNISVRPRIPHKNALLEKCRASALFFHSHTEIPGVLTGKLFDYLGSGRPILAYLGDEISESKRLLDKTGAGSTAANIKQLADLLADWYQRWKRNPAFALERNEGEIATYSRRTQTKTLAETLNEICH